MGRRLSDTYGNSLVFTNLQLIRYFGYVDRGVPAHMPHLINRRVMDIIEQNMAQFFNQTIHHRVREDTDLQYAFLYFHYLYHLERQKQDNWGREVWKRIDANGDGVLNGQEIQTLNLIMNEEKASEA